MPVDYEYQSRRDRPEPETGPSGAARFKALRGPVGIRHGTQQVANKLPDQRAVMDMLDKLRTDFGGNRKGDGTFDVLWPPAVEGKCHIALFTVILRVQTYFYSEGLLGFHPDGVIDSGGRTEQLIQHYSGEEPPFPASDPKEIAKSAIPLALQWARGASNYLLTYKLWRLSNQPTPPGNFDPTAANIHLHLDGLGTRDIVVRVDEWMENYQLIAKALVKADDVFVRATREEALEARNTMDCWGVGVPAWAIANEHIWFGPDMLGLGPKCKAAILLHEGGHYIRDKIGHQGGERGPDYDNQSADDALTSAYVCANFATHATTGRDERFGLARADE
jgi:hypothetical protein